MESHSSLCLKRHFCTAEIKAPEADRRAKGENGRVCVTVCLFVKTSVYSPNIVRGWLAATTNKSSCLRTIRAPQLWHQRWPRLQTGRPGTCEFRRFRRRAHNRRRMTLPDPHGLQHSTLSGTIPLITVWSLVLVVPYGRMCVLPGQWLWSEACRGGGGAAGVAGRSVSWGDKGYKTQRHQLKVVDDGLFFFFCVCVWPNKYKPAFKTMSFSAAFCATFFIQHINIISGVCKVLHIKFQITHPCRVVKTIKDALCFKISILLILRLLTSDKGTINWN